MFKRLAAVATTTALTVAMAVTAFAAGSVNAEEQKVLDALKAEGVPAAQVEQVQKVFMEDSVSLTADNANTAIANIGDAKKIASEAGYTSVAALLNDAKNGSADVQKKAQDVINGIVAKVNATREAIPSVAKVTKAVTFNAKTGTLDGGVITDGEIANTGVDFSTTAAVVAGLGLSVAGIAVIAKKKDLVNA